MTLAGTPEQLAAVAWHGAALDTLVVTGSRRAAQRFVRCFALG